MRIPKRLMPPIVSALLAVACSTPVRAENPPGHMSYVQWDFAQDAVRSIEFEVNIENDPGNAVGLYFSPYNARIGSEFCYFGIQNLLWKQGCKPEKGILFSRWGTRDLANTRPSPGGWNVSMGNEGDFVSVRKFIDWKPGKFTFKLAPKDTDAEGVWYEFSIIDSQQRETSAGCLKFPLVHGKPPLIDCRGTSFMEFYSGAKSPKDVPFWKIGMSNLTANGGTMSLSRAVSIYPHPQSYLKNADVYADGATIWFLVGRGVKQQHAAGILFPQEVNSKN